MNINDEDNYVRKIHPNSIFLTLINVTSYRVELILVVFFYLIHYHLQKCFYFNIHLYLERYIRL